MRRSKNAKNMAASRAKIKQLEGEIATLKNIVRHYLEEIKRLGEENEGLKQEIQQVQQKNEQLKFRNTPPPQRATLSLPRPCRLAKKLNITGISFHAYNKKGKTEKNITKAAARSAFHRRYNNTTIPGHEGFLYQNSLTGRNVAWRRTVIRLDDSTISSTSHRKVEYANERNVRGGLLGCQHHTHPRRLHSGGVLRWLPSRLSSFHDEEITLHNQGVSTSSFRPRTFR